MQANTITYKELSRGRVSKSRNAVVSACSAGGYTMAQQFEAVENGKIISVFLKGAMHIDDIEGLRNLRTAIESAIEAEEKRLSKENVENS